jgi:hypothetical protein
VPTSEANQDFLEHTVLVFLSKISRDINTFVSRDFPVLNLKYLINDLIYECTKYIANLDKLPATYTQFLITKLVAIRSNIPVVAPETQADVTLAGNIAPIIAAPSKDTISAIIPQLDDAALSINYRMVAIGSILSALTSIPNAYDLIIQVLRLIRLNIDTQFIGILPTIADLCTEDYKNELIALWTQLSNPYKSVEILEVDTYSDIILFIHRFINSEVDFYNPAAPPANLGEPAKSQRYIARIASLALVYDAIRQDPTEYSYFAYLAPAPAEPPLPADPPIVLRQIDLVTRIRRLIDMLQSIAIGVQNLRLGPVIQVLNSLLGGSRKSRKRRDKIRHHSTRRRK